MMFPFRIACVSFSEIQEAALGAFNLYLSDRPGYGTVWRPMTLTSPRWRMERITVDYICHKLTDYDALVAMVSANGEGKTGVDRMRCALMITIADAYPQLAGECERQMRSTWSGVRVIMRRAGRRNGELLGSRVAEAGTAARLERGYPDAAAI